MGSFHRAKLTHLGFLALASILFGLNPLRERSRQAEGQVPSAHLPYGNGQEAVWRVDLIPEATIGLENGPDPYILTNVQDATLLSDGTVVVGMYLRNFFELRYYDGRGNHLASAGRHGQGPFEVSGGFLDLGRLAGDSLLVAGLDHRFSVFGPRGERVRSGRFSLRRPYTPAGLIADRYLGLFVVEPTSGRGVQQGGVSFMVLDMETEEVDSVGRVPSSRTLIDDSGLYLHFPFEPAATWAFGGGRLWFGTSGSREIAGWDPIERQVVTTLVQREPSRVTRQDRDRWKERDLRGTSGEERARVASHHRGLAFPESFPVHQGLQVDSEGNLWVLLYEPPWSEADYEWEVLDSGGARLARASIPFEVLGSFVRSRPRSGRPPLLEIGADRILVKLQDDLGVERVQVHRLHKDSAPGT